MKPDYFSNVAGIPDIDACMRAELGAAGIESVTLPLCMRDDTREVKANVVGQIGPWGFDRAWRYWVAKGPGLPLLYADPLHQAFGSEVRVDGHCGCPSPREWHKGFAVGLYHVDTARGLLALAETLKLVIRQNS